MAFFASVAASKTADPDLNRHTEGLLRFVAATHDLVVERLGDGPDPPPLKAAFDRHDSGALLDDSFYAGVYVM